MKFITNYKLKSIGSTLKKIDEPIVKCEQAHALEPTSAGPPLPVELDFVDEGLAGYGNATGGANQTSQFVSTVARESVSDQ